MYIKCNNIFKCQNETKGTKKSKKKCKMRIMNGHSDRMEFKAFPMNLLF